MKNKGMIIGLIFLCSVVAITLVFLMIGLLNGNFKKFHLYHFSKMSDNQIMDKVYENKFNEININSSVSDVNIKHSDSSKIRIVVYGDENSLNVDKDNKKLNITLKEKNCIGFCFNVIQTKIEIYLPSDYDKKITVNNNYGDIKIDKYLSADIYVKEDCGDVTILGGNRLDIVNSYGDIKVEEGNDIKIKEEAGDVTITKGNDVVVENNYGDIKIESVLNYLKVNQDCGDVKIDSLNINKDSSIINKFGDISIKKTSQIYIDAKTNLGDTKIKRNYRNESVSLILKNNCGDIKVEN